MEYIVSLSSQTKGFLLSMGFGMLLGVVYDLIRIIRLSFTRSEAALAAFDIFYALVCGVATFLFMLSVTDGQLRFFIVFGEIIGFFVYYFTFGALAVKFSRKTVEGIKTVLSKFLSFLLSPFKKIFHLIRTRLSGFSQKTYKKSKKLIKNVKYLLHSNSKLLYNLTDKTHIFSKKSDSEKAENNMNKTAKKKQNKKLRKYSFFLLIGLLVAVGYGVVNFINNQMEIKAKKAQIAQLQSQVEAQAEENAEIRNVLDGGNQDEYIEKVAREKLGYVKPGEKVYYNVTPSN